MADSVHPGSWIGDSVEEFKKLPTWGKFAVGGLALFVVWLGYSAYRNRGASGSSQATSLPATSNAPGSSSPFSMVGNSPLLPSNVNPLYDPSGNLVAFQQGAAPGSSPTSAPTTAPSPTQVGATPNPPASNPVKAIAGYLGLLGPNAQVHISANKKAGDSYYTNAQGQKLPIPVPAGDQLVQGGQGRVWYTDQGGQHLLTSGAGPAIDPTTNSPATQQSSPAVTNNIQADTNKKNVGAGGESWQSRLRGLRTYTPQYGDNMNEVANKLGLKGGWQAFGVPSFEHGVPVAIPNMPAMPGMPNIQQNEQGQSVSMPGINIHQSDQGQSIQVGNQQITQGRP